MSSTFIAKGPDGYDQYMGRWSKRLAPLFLDFAGVADGERILDVGCGTGSRTFLIPDRANIASIEAIDFEAQFVGALKQRNTDQRISARQGDACSLPFGENDFDRAMSMLVLHFVPAPELAIAEMLRVVRPGGIVAAAVWDTFGGMPSQRMFWDTFAAIEPAALVRRSRSLVRPMTLSGRNDARLRGCRPRKYHRGDSDYPNGFCEFRRLLDSAHQRPRHVGGILFSVTARRSRASAGRCSPGLSFRSTRRSAKFREYGVGRQRNCANLIECAASAEISNCRTTCPLLADFVVKVVCWLGKDCD